MLEECHNVMSIRWPDGRRKLDEFAQWLDQSYASAEAANLLASLRELLFPLKFDPPSKFEPIDEVLQPKETAESRSR